MIKIVCISTTLIGGKTVQKLELWRLYHAIETVYRGETYYQIWDVPDSYGNPTEYSRYLFITLAEYRDKQIESILTGKDIQKLIQY